MAEGFVKQASLSRQREWGCYEWWEWGIDRKKQRDRYEKWWKEKDWHVLKERIRELIPETKWKERSVICNEEDVGGSARMTRDEERVKRGVEQR